MDETIVSSKSLDEDIEILEDFEPLVKEEKIEVLSEDEGNEISINQLLTEVNDKKKEEQKILEKKKDKTIEKIQIFLIVFLVVTALIIYFFGYDFFEPYIKID